jgi:hypothetical protein
VSKIQDTFIVTVQHDCQRYSRELVHLYRGTLEGGEEPEGVVLPPSVGYVDDGLVVQPVEGVGDQLVLQQRPQHAAFNSMSV